MAGLVEVGLFVSGFLLGMVWCTAVILPLFVALPRALVWAGRGLIRPRGAFRYLIPPAIWLGVLLAAAFFLYVVFPKTLSYLNESRSFTWGQNLAVFFLLGRAVLSKSGRADLTNDFLGFMQPYFTNSGAEA